jgi:NhaA family Na+:H+ antiporter
MKSKVSRSPLGPFVEFLHTEAASGIILLACTAFALLAANSRWHAEFAQLWHTPLGLEVGNFRLIKPLELWINDGLMTLFFFVVGLEIKRELVAGELRDPRKAALPAAAALGGMVVPALIYLLYLRGQPGERGWGIPMATDIAFVVGFLALLGPRVPPGLKIMLLSLAIVDDLGSVLVIAVVYTSDISLTYLGLGGAGLVLVLALRLGGVRAIGLYFVMGVGIWLAVLKSGVHPTVAGVLLGLLTPAKGFLQRQDFLSVNDRVARLFRQPKRSGDEDEALYDLVKTANNTSSPLNRLMLGLHPWVAFVIMPLFALANAGVPIVPDVFGKPVSIAVAAGLLLGKPIGIVLFSQLAVRLKIARLPAGMDSRVLVGAGFLGGIGFTMSLFIAGLALQGDLLLAGKVGTLVGSSVSAAIGFFLLRWFLPAQVPRQGDD